MSESELPLRGGAGGTGVLSLIGLLALVAAIWQSGIIGYAMWAIVDGIFGFLMTILVVVVILAFFPLILRVVVGAIFSILGSIVGGVITGGVSAAGGCLGGRSAGQGGLSLICRDGQDTQREVRFHALGHVPAGSVIRVFGPRVMGVHHAWVIVNRTLGQTLLARGVGSALALPVLAMVAWAWLMMRGMN